MTRPTPPPRPDGTTASPRSTEQVRSPLSPSHRASPGARLARTLWMAAAPLIVLLLALLFLLTSGDLTGREAGYPRVLAVIVAVLSAVGVFRDIATARQADADGEFMSGVPGDDELEHHDAADDPEGRRGAGLAIKRVLAFLGVSVVAVFLMNHLGFFTPALLLLGGGLFVLGIRTPWKVVAYTALLVSVAYALFVEALQVPFPPAPWS